MLQVDRRRLHAALMDALPQNGRYLEYGGTALSDLARHFPSAARDTIDLLFAQALAEVMAELQNDSEKISSVFVAAEQFTHMVGPSWFGTHTKNLVSSLLNTSHSLWKTVHDDGTDAVQAAGHVCWK